ncbi:MAG TPA: hypothetical protein VIV40_44200 [Kofleriaceae bacterium]
MTRAFVVMLLCCATASAEPVKLKLTHEPPPRNLRMRPRTAAAATAPEPSASPAAAPETEEAVKASAREPAVELGQVRDLRRPISVRFNLGYVVDGTALTGDKNLAEHQVGTYEFSQLRAYALGEGYFSSRGVALPSLSTYFAGRFQLMRRTLSADPSDPSGTEVQVAPPIANWFERSGFEVRSGWAEVQDFLPDKRLAPVRLRAGNLYVYGPWVLHMNGAVAAWEGKLIRASLYGGSRVPDYTLVNPLDGKNRAGIGGSSLRVDFRNLKTPIPFAISGEFLGFTAVGATSNESSNHSQVQLDWRPRKDVALIGSARTLDGELANEHLQLRSRYKQVTNLVFDITHRRRTDWRWDPSVPQSDPLESKRYLDLGPVLPQLLVSGRAGTLIKENIDLLLRGAYANDLVTTDVERNTFAASYLEVGGGLEVRLRRTIGLGLNGLTRQTKRYAAVELEIPDLPNQIDPLPRQFGSELGEESFTELGATVRMSLGARRFSALVEIYGRRTRYALDYCNALKNGGTPTAFIDPNCMSALDTGIQDRDYRGGGRATIDAWIGSQLRLFASYELSSRLDLQREIYGFKSLRLMMEGVY